MTYDPTNIFAKIIQGEAPCVKVYEDRHTLAFMDVMPQTPGHTLVIPKEAAENIYDLSTEMAGNLIKTTQKIARAVKQALDCEGIMLAQLNGAAAGQSVFHIHFHIIPRDSGIDMKLHARDMADMEELEIVAEKIRAAIE